MTQSLKTIGVFIFVFAIIGAVMTYFGLPASSDAKSASSSATFAVSISPEQLTRDAAPMPTQQLESYQ